MECPRCGHASQGEPICPRCGVVFAKIQERPPRAAARPAPSPPRRPSLVPVLLAVLAGAVFLGIWYRPRLVRPERSPAPPRSAPRGPASLPVPNPPRILLPDPARRPPLQQGPSADAGDVSAAQLLSSRLTQRAPVSPEDVRTAEDLRARHPDEGALRDLLVATLAASAQQDRTARRYPSAAATLRRAQMVDPSEPTLPLALMGILLEAGDWQGAEAAARDVLTLDPRQPDALEGLGYALFRQDRNREARDTLRVALDARPSDSARSLLARIDKESSDETGMTEQRLAHFNVRYDGEAHDEVGREILRALERHYATLVRTFDHRPTATVPVILFSRQAYYDASGAPAWSGGVFDHADGRIRIPIQGLTGTLTPDMDETLIHELSHAFIHDRSRGTAPREVHEGVAQYMEGKRIDSMLSPEEVHALADGRVPGVAGFYLRALSFVEYLMAQRGQGGINDLLGALGETGSVDQAFRRVYGHDYRATREEWEEHFRRRYGS